MSKEALQRVKPITEDFKAQGIIILCSNPCNTPVLPVRKPKGQEWRFVQDPWAIHNAVIARRPVAPTDIHSRWEHIFTVIDWCSAFFSILAGKASQYLFALGKMTLHLEKNAPGFHRKSVLLFTNLESWYKVFCGFYLVTVYRWFTTYRCSPSWICSQEDSIHLLKLLT